MCNKKESCTTETSWLESYVQEAKEKNLCMKMYCTTCGAIDFRKGLFQKAGEIAGMVPSDRLDASTAREIIRELSTLGRVESVISAETMMLILLDLNQILGTPELENQLGSCWARDILTNMKSHHEQRLESARQHKIRNDPVLARVRREKKQEEHLKRVDAARKKSWPPLTEAEINKDTSQMSAKNKERYYLWIENRKKQEE